MLVELTLLIAAGLGNLAWDLTGRRISARARRRARRERRRESLPLPAADELAQDPFEAVVGLAPAAFVEHTRATAEELDRVVDHFDLVLLRAEAGESLVGDIVYIGAEAPRERGRELLDAWLGAVTELPADVAERLRDLGLPDQPLADALERERARNYWPNVATSSDLLEATASDFEGAVVLLVAFLRTLTVATSDPYR
ncbi:hypothetical protein ENSA5_40430 [Enhygromyxa salina]|uniref:Uncharacterized protein n=1 Tax=Enhygromyxa salina TaxID=215803 RepID=A0A2S9XPP9_9BACT|nr:hypothetical protein [Enhygromyxa salina]PRP94720.1 hypothetical protein ENSA5_40430 [Enhygromyxa salina]